MSKLTLEPPSDSDAMVAARHLCVLLTIERPDLWPALNAASLGRGGGRRLAGRAAPDGGRAPNSSVISPIALTAASRIMRRSRLEHQKLHVPGDGE